MGHAGEASVKDLTVEELKGAPEDAGAELVRPNFPDVVASGKWTLLFPGRWGQHARGSAFEGWIDDEPIEPPRRMKASGPVRFAVEKGGRPGELRGAVMI